MKDGTYKTQDGRTLEVKNTDKGVLITDKATGQTTSVGKV